MDSKTKIVVAYELHQQGLPSTHISKYLGIHRETAGIWISSIKQQGLENFLDSYTKAKQGERKGRQVDPILKRRVWEIRERESNCCGQKIQYFLEKEYNLNVSVPKIYEILKEKYKIRSKWKKNTKRGPVPKATAPREVVQIDSVDFGEVFAFTGVDIYTREVDVVVAAELTSENGAKFLEVSMRRRFNGHVDLIQTDGGCEFEKEFKVAVNNYCRVHRVARPYKKNEQAYIESFNRTLRKECLGWKKYRREEVDRLNGVVEEYMKRYHYHRPHIGLGMRTPL